MNKLLLLLLLARTALAAPKGDSNAPDLDGNGEVTEQEYNKWAMDGARKEYEEAQPVTIRAKVVDEAGAPLGGAVVVAEFQHEVHEFSQEFHTKSNILGGASFIGRCSREVSLYAKLDGYFGSSTRANVLTEVRVRDPKERMGWSNLKTWHDRDVTLVMKKKKAGIPMIAIVRKSWELPTDGKEFGFDLMEMDWVKPQGMGEVADVMMKAEVLFLEENNAKRFVKLHARFPNQGDGIASLPSGNSEPTEANPVGYGTGFAGQADAPAEGYKAERTWTGQFSIEEIDYFRIRTKLDSNGKVTSALYGKMYDATFNPFYWHEEKESSVFTRTLYLNPTPNDRNMVCNGISLYEFDLKTGEGRAYDAQTKGKLQP